MTPPFDKGDPLSADALDRLSEETTARTISHGARLYHARQHSRGTLLFRKPSYFDPPARSRGAATGCPFDISITPDELADLYASFRAGTINSLLPDNYLDGVLVPDTGTKYLVLNCTASSGAITGATFSADTSPPAAIAPTTGAPPTSFAILIGVCTDGVATKVWGCGNIQALPVEAFRTQKVTPVAGQVPYDVYYTWSFTLL